LARDLPLSEVARLALHAWRALTSAGTFKPPDGNGTDPQRSLSVEGRTLEWALLDRRITAGSRYRVLTPAELS
jgi:hypothetical protein